MYWFYDGYKWLLLLQINKIGKKSMNELRMTIYFQIL